MKQVFPQAFKAFFICILIAGFAPIQAGSVSDFDEFTSIATNGARDWESFTIGSDSYIAVANYSNGSTTSVNSVIYKWNGTTFTSFQSIATKGARDWEYFTIDGDHYLAVANSIDGSSFTTNSYIYKWNGSSFALEQTISTDGGFDWEFFNIGSDSYLAIANEQDSSGYNVDSEIYKWNGTSFTLFQTIGTSGGRDWEPFIIGSDVYLAVANFSSPTTTNINSVIYKWNGTNFAQEQTIATKGAHDWEFFCIGGQPYLAVANHNDGTTFNVDSKIYKWNGSSFAEFQTIPTSQAGDWKFFSVEGEDFLASANGHNDTTRNINSKIYKWSGASFVEFQAIVTNGAAGWDSFTINTDTYLAVANWHNDSSNNINSKIFKADVVATSPGDSLWTQGTGDNIYRLDGNVGIGTSSPQTKTHIADGDTPTLRLEQDNSESNTPQTWDVAGNETQFYVSDITNTKTPFGIAPNSPEDSIFIGTGGVGVKTATPDSAAHIIGKVLISDADDGAVTGQNYLHIVGEDSSLHIERDSTTTNDSLNIMNLVNNGRIFLRMEDTSNSKIWNTGTQNNDYFINDGGDTEIEFRLYQNGNLTITGSLTEMSDRASKENIRAVDPSQILSKVIDLPLNTWNYIDTEDEVVHLGPMAQDFYAAFGLNNSPKGISSLDTSGVALAAIQGLNQALEEKDAKFNQLLEEKDAKFNQLLEEKDARIQGLENRLKALEELLNTSVDRK